MAPLHGFNFVRLPKIIFGAGKIHQLPKELKDKKHILLLTGGQSLKKSGDFDRIYNLLKNHLHIYSESIKNEPSPENIDSITQTYHLHNVDAVLAIGGGSVLDAGKAISAMLPINGKITEYLEGVGTKKPKPIKVPFIAAPTTSGTGSETTKNAVISQVGDNGFKKSLRHDHYIPDVTIVDPELILNCPPNITAASGMDAFTQLLEAYLSPTCDPMTASLIISALEAVERSLVKVYKNGQNLSARTDIAYAAMISGIALANAGLGTIHGFASPIGAFHNIPHGVVCGTLMAACNKYTVHELRNSKNTEALGKYVKVASIFIKSQMDSESQINAFIEWLYQTTELLEIPGLGKYGVGKNDIDKIVAASGNKNNPVALDNSILKAILEERI